MSRSGRDADGSALVQILRRLWRETFSDHASIVSAGLAYYAIFGLLPAIAGAAALWGLFGDTSALRQTLHQSGTMLPDAMVGVIDQFVTSVPQGFGGGLAFALNVLLVVWTAFRAAGGLLTALNIIYDVDETRGRLACWFVSLAIGVGGILLLFVSIAALALAPLLAAWAPSEMVLPLLWLRWPGLVALFAIMLGLLFRYGPNREAAPLSPLLWGTLSGTLLSTSSSAAISFYAARFANYGHLYGSLGSIAVVLLWLYTCAFAILIGAQIDDVLSKRKGRAA